MAEFNGPNVSWKKLWQLISGIHYETPCQVVATKLTEVSAELLAGLGSKTSETDVARVIKDKPTLLAFSNHLASYLSLTPVESSNLICSYLMYEYKGSATSLINCLATDHQKHKLLVDISKYHSLERFVLLKIVRNLLEQGSAKNHPYHEEYSAIVTKLTVPAIRKSYIGQLDGLVRNSYKTPSQHNDFLGLSGPKDSTTWSERRMHETVEVLQIILLTVEQDGIVVEELGLLVELFRVHSFGRLQSGLDGSHMDLINKIAYSEVALLLKCLDISQQSEHKFDATYVQETIKQLDYTLITFNQNPEHGPILLVWMLFNYKNITSAEDDEQQIRFRQFGTRATHLGVFEYLHTMLRHPMYRDLSVLSRIVRRTIYGHLNVLCDIFDGDGSVAHHKQIYELLSELLRTPSIARDFCNREDGCRSLYNTALENFPVEFVPLAMIAEAIASTGFTQQHYIRKQLENLPIYTEYLRSYSTCFLRALTDSPDASEYALTADYSPFKKIDFVITAGTTALVQDRANCSTIHFRTNLNFFDVLHNEIDELLVETVRYTDFDSDRKTRVTAGLKYLASALSGVVDPLHEISNEMVHPTEMVFDLLTKFKLVTQPPIELMSKCLNVCVNLVPLFDLEIVRRIINLNMLPSINGDQLDYRALSLGAGFESGLVGYYLINFEKNSGQYDFLLTYLHFLRTYTKLPRNAPSAGIELPGLIFMLREVLPHIHSWRFVKDSDRERIYTLIFQYFLDILQTPDDAGNEYRTLLRNVCVYSLLHLDNGTVLLRFVAIGNDHLQSIMQNVSNWMTTSESGLNLLVQLAMTILMQILRLRHCQTDSEIVSSHPHHSSHQTLSPLESIIYTQPKQRDTLRIIPVVTSYMSNIFNRRLPLLSCRLLRRFAIEFQMSLLACLDMEPDQIRLTFLQRLPDDLESDQLKIAVIEFVEACISKQPGLTEAFFKIKNERRHIQKGPKPKDIGDGILTYMTQYLDTIAQDPLRISSPLLSKIMSLFHALWKNNMQSLVQDLIADTDFWTSLFNPLFGPIKPDIQAYSQLFNILGIEMFRYSNDNPMDESSPLYPTYKRFFSSEHFEKWIDHVLTLPRETITDQVLEETPEWLCRLQSFKDLIVLVMRKKAITIPNSSKTIFARKCLQVLVDRSEYLDDYRPFIILSELYLILLMSFDCKYTETSSEDTDLLNCVTRLLNQTAISYRDINARARESVLAIALRSIELHQKALFTNHDSVNAFMQSIVEILCYELSITENLVIANKKLVDQTQHTANAHLSFVLSLTLLKKMLQTSATEQFSTKWQQHIISNRIVNRLLSCLNASLQIYQFRKIVTEMLDVLIVLAQSSCSSELLHTDIGNYLWMKLLPPKELLQILGNASTPSDRSITKTQVTEPATERRWQTNDWWPIYARGIQLVTVLLQEHRHIFIKDALLFVGVHEEFIVDSILLGKHTMDAEAIVLIRTALFMVAEMVNYEKYWRLEHSSSMISLMRSVQSILDHSVSLLYRPKILKRLMDGVATSKLDLTLFDSSTALTPTDELTAAMNDLIDVVTICSRCLLAFSPKLLDMLVEPNFSPSQWQPLVEIQFGAPKLYVGNTTPQLTFGTILSAITIFTKALNLRNYAFTDAPFNRIGIRDEPDMVDVNANAASTTTSMPSSVSNSTARFSKTLSMTSNASATLSAPSNEILTNLDEKSCLTGLEFALTLLCTQSLLAMKDINLSTREKQLIKRELSTELAVFHEFVRKRIMTDAKGPLYRKKRGVAIILATKSAYETMHIAVERPISGPVPTTRYRPTMREKVIRQQHQTAAAAALNLNPQSHSLKRPPMDLSPIVVGDTSSTPRKLASRPSHLTSSTPLESTERVLLKPHTGRLATFSESSVDTVDRSDTDDEPVFHDAIDCNAYTGLSMVQMVEADYLHLLSIVFMHICQHE